MDLDRYFSAAELRSLEQIREDGASASDWDDPLMKRYRELGLVGLGAGRVVLTAFGRYELKSAAAVADTASIAGSRADEGAFKPFNFPG